VDAKVKQKTLRMLSNGVYVLTSRSEGRYGAATVTWVSQASFKPPLIMAAVRRESNVFECLSESGSSRPAHRGATGSRKSPGDFSSDPRGARNHKRRSVHGGKDRRARIAQLARAH